MKRSLVLVLLLAMVTLTVGPAVSAFADRPSTDEYDFIWAENGFDGEIGWVEFSLYRPNPDGGDSDPPSIFVEAYLADQDLWIETVDPGQVTFAGDGFEAELVLSSSVTGDIVGSATVEGTLEQVGELEFRFDEQRKVDNRLVREYQSAAPVAVAGSLEVTVDGYAPEAFDLAECEAERLVGTIYQTNPAGTATHWTSVGFDCDALSADGWTAMASLDAVQRDGPNAPRGAEVYAWTPGTNPDDDGPALVGLGTDVKTTPSSLSAEVGLWDTTSDAPDGVAVIDAAYALDAVFEQDVVFQGGWARVMIASTIVEGSLTLDEVVFDLAPCEGWVVTFDLIEHPNRSQGKGRVPANDLPEGAYALQRFSNDHTRMASPEPEVPCMIDEGAEYPIGKTLWYTVTGTGAIVTVDTEGTNFDTVMGVYTLDDGELVQEACVDDVGSEDSFTNLASVEIETKEGMVYYIQIGGFDYQYGLLKVAVR